MRAVCICMCVPAPSSSLSLSLSLSVCVCVHGSVAGGNYKVYWMIDSGSSTPLPPGLKPGLLSLDAPVIFDLSTDHAEEYPLNAGSATWRQAKSAASPFTD